MKTEKELIELKDKVEDAKLKKASLQGQIDTLMNQIKTEFNCSDINNANERLKVLFSERDAIYVKIKEGVEKIELKYQ